MKTEIKVHLPTMAKRCKDRIPPEPDSENLILVDFLVTKVSYLTGEVEIIVSYEEYDPETSFGSFADRAKAHALAVIGCIDFPGIIPGMTPSKSGVTDDCQDNGTHLSDVWSPLFYEETISRRNTRHDAHI